ncbi:MAG: hypothetical protein AAF757_24195 [Cyanobacteria bacterium P01_D01_bin.116]
MKELHPSELFDRTRDLIIIKAATIGLLALSITATATAATSPKPRKTWLAGTALGLAVIGCGVKALERDKKESLQDLQLVSSQGWRSLLAQSFLPAAKVSATFNSKNWTPTNLVTDPVEYINKVQKHVALVGGTGDGKSTQAQYFSTRIGGEVIVYDVDSSIDDWTWIKPDNLFGDNGLTDVNEAMGEALQHLEKMRVYRKTVSKNIPDEYARFYIAEEYPVLSDCENSHDWIRQHAKVGRKRKQFIMVLAQNDTAANFDLEGDADILDTCFVRIRLGKKAQDYARTKLKSSELEQWLKSGGKKRFMLDDQPCELDLSNWGMIQQQQDNQLPGNGNRELGVGSEEPQLNEFESYILDWGKQNPDQLLKARIVQQNSRLFENISADDIRLMFIVLADKGFGTTANEGNRLAWVYSKPVDNTPTR